MLHHKGAITEEDDALNRYANDEDVCWGAGGSWRGWRGENSDIV
jgi:hypothetical protein